MNNGTSKTMIKAEITVLNTVLAIFDKARRDVMKARKSGVNVVQAEATYYEFACVRTAYHKIENASLSTRIHEAFSKAENRDLKAKLISLFHEAKKAEAQAAA